MKQRLFIILIFLQLSTISIVKCQQAATNMNWTSGTVATINGIGVSVAFTNMTSTNLGPSAVSAGTYSCNPLASSGSVEGSVAAWGTGSNNPTPTATITFASPVLDTILYVQAMDFRRFNLAGTLQTDGNPIVVTEGCLTGGVTLAGTSLASNGSCASGNAVVRLTGLYSVINITRPWKCDSPNDGTNFTLGFRNDYGDAPTSYGTPVHNIPESQNLLLGTIVDSESETPITPGTTAGIDGTDEDGVATIDIIPNTNVFPQVIPTYSITTSFINNTGQTANYAAWIDWNNNGIFDAGEAQTATTPSSTTSGNVTFTWTNVTLSGATGLLNTYARIRVSNQVIAATNASTAFLNGEVEDYAIPFAIALQIKLTNFLANIIGTTGALSWKTENESNILKYDIEISNNGTFFQNIGSVLPASRSQNDYYFNYFLSNEKVYYNRLKIVEKNGDFSYSNIIVLRTEKNKQFLANVYPNPVKENLIIYLPFSEKVKVKILNKIGEILKQTIIEKNTNNITLENFKKGVYFIHLINTKNELIVKKIFKD